MRQVFLEGFFVCLGVCAELYFAVFAKIDGGPCHERPRGDLGEHAPIYCERVDKKTAFSTMQEIILFGNFFRVTISMYCGLVILRL